MAQKMKTKLITILLYGIFTNISAQKYFSINEIPLTLKENADAVVRVDETEFIIENYGKIVTKHHWAVTIFNEEGENKYALFRADYDKFKKIKKIEGTIYDKIGTELKKLKSSDIQDISIGSGEYITDNRTKIAKFDKKFYPYPYTLEFSYEDESTNTLFYPAWEPVPNENTGVQVSTFVIKTAQGISFRKKELNIKFPSQKFKEGKFDVEKWDIRDVAPFESENFSLNNQMPVVFFAPIEYSVDGYSGKLNNWNDVAQFYLKVNAGRDILPQSTIDKLKLHVGQEKDTAAKVKKVYEFMQSHTRYFLVALGIGGWQSTPASEVAEKGYGDCKALTNYTISLLKQVGVKAYPALIYADDDSKNHYEYQDFPRPAFNHVIACVPTQKDTLWLECTSQTNPFGYLGSFTGNRNALLVKENEGKLISTINYFPEKNHQKREAKVKVDATGNAEVHLVANYTGLQQETRSSVAEQLNFTEQKEWLHKNLDIPNVIISNFKISTEKTGIPKINEEISLVANRYASFTGDRLFVKPNLLTKFLSPTDNEKERKNDLYLNPNSYSFLDDDILEFEIPEGYKAEFIPKEIKVTKKFGEYSAVTTVQGNKLHYKRSLKVNGGLYDKSDYTAWTDFLKTISKADNQKAVFVKAPRINN